ncbi:Do family serine endopeptidase [bacterium]|nr:Do family serine endopeptidase [bacterium]
MVMGQGLRTGGAVIGHGAQFAPGQGQIGGGDQEPFNEKKRFHARAFTPWRCKSPEKSGFSPVADRFDLAWGFAIFAQKTPRYCGFFHSLESAMLRMPRCHLLVAMLAIFSGSQMVFVRAMAATPIQVTPAARSIENLADIVQSLMPAVVNISTTQKPKGRGPEMPGVDGNQQMDELQDFFEQFYGSTPQGPNGGDSAVGPRAHSLGSGFIVDASGLIVTNNHVVADADEIVVKLQDGAEYRAKIIGRDMKTDLCLLKIDAGKALPFVKFGDSNGARVGDWVIAIGNPFGLGGSVTVGIISARARDINAGPFDDFIQTDAAINSGNSGGPMFNIKGEVVGINTAIFTPTGGNVGIGFATPASMAAPVVEQLKRFGKMRWGWLGVKIQAVSKEIAESINLGESKGALVVDVTPNSPATKAGLVAGDVITRFDNQPVTDMRSFPKMVAQTAIGREVPLTVWRQGKEMSLKATVEEAKDNDAAKVNEKPQPEPDKTPAPGVKVMGMKLQAINSALRKDLDLPVDVNGVMVVDVDKSSAAWDQGIRQEDVLTRANETPLNQPDDLKKVMDKATKEGRKHVLVRIYRQGDTHFVTLPTSNTKD